MLSAVSSVMKAVGPTGLARAIVRRIRGTRARSYPACAEIARGKEGLEIGGPSAIFSHTGLIPLYPLVRKLDNCNFDSATVWDGQITEGKSFHFDNGKEKGKQYIQEATDLGGIPDESFDFVLASHMLEHTANPLAAVQESTRVLREDGALVLIVPHKDGTFDRRRPVTSLEHLIDDLHDGTGEDDLTHLPEILALHDTGKDPGVKTLTEFKERARENYENRCLHHHVFNTPLVVELLDYMGLQIVAAEAQLPYHIIAVAQKVLAGESKDNSSLCGRDAEYRMSSPFPSDRVN
jgi:SAM-dependent methyltransferase